MIFEFEVVSKVPGEKGLYVMSFTGEYANHNDILESVREEGWEKHWGKQKPRIVKKAPVSSIPALLFTMLEEEEKLGIRKGVLLRITSLYNMRDVYRYDDSRFRPHWNGLTRTPFCTPS